MYKDNVCCLLCVFDGERDVGGGGGEGGRAGSNGSQEIDVCARGEKHK